MIWYGRSRKTSKPSQRFPVICYGANCDWRFAWGDREVIEAKADEMMAALVAEYGHWEIEQG